MSNVQQSQFKINANVVGITLIAWILVGMFHSFSRYRDVISYGSKVEFGFIEALGYVMSYSTWALVTLFLLHTFRKLAFPFSRSTLAIIFVATLVIWLPLYISIDYTITTLLLDKPISDLISKLQNTSFSTIFFYSVVFAFTYATCLGIFLSVKNRQTMERALTLEKQQTQAQLQLAEQNISLMQSQLSPHFLFNCLGAISSLARDEHSSKIVDAVAKLGNLLRFSIGNAGQKYILLSEELQFLQDYIELQKLRFEHKFSYQLKTENLSDNLMCPPFLLQPLAENAFVHAVELAQSPIQIFIHVVQTDSMLAISVINSKSSQSKVSDHEGTGLQNLKARLNYLYKDAYHIDIAEHPTSFEICINIPSKR